jgi:hypothetical protein
MPDFYATGTTIGTGVEYVLGSDVVDTYSSTGNLLTVSDDFVGNVDLPFIRIAENIKLEKNKNNFLIINNGQEVIVWDENNNSWSISKVKSFTNNFKEKSCNKELAFSKSENFALSNNVLNFINFITEKNGNYYIDLDKDLYYKFFNNHWIGLEILGEFNIEIEREININSLKHNKKNSKLLLEKLSKLELGVKSNNFMGAGLIYAPYVPVQSSSLVKENNNGRFYPKKGLMTRYSNTTVNNDFYTTINTNNTNITHAII